MTTRPLSRATPLPAEARFVTIGPEHAASLGDLFERNAELERTGLFDPFPLTADTARRIAAGERRDLYFGAERPGELIGMTMLRGLDQGYEIPSFGILIDRAHRGQTLGRAMTELTLGHAHGLGCGQVRLSVYGANRAARRLYEQLGFTERTRTPVNVAGRQDEKIVMTLALTGR